LESSWRYNVPLFGSAYQGVEFYAPLVTPLGGFYQYLMKLEGFENVFYARILFQELVTYTGGALPPADHPHFPWGIDVLPD
jgi:hypothetical protein